MSAASQSAALLRLWQLAQGNHGACRVAVSLLAGLYNGNRFRFDLTDLRLLDALNLEAAMTVIHMDASRCHHEVHELLNLLLGVRICGQRLEVLAYDWKLKGRCTKQRYEECLRQLQRAAAGGASSACGAGS